MCVNFTHCTACGAALTSSLLLSLDRQVVTFDYGRKGQDPMDCMYFYHKDNPNCVVELQKEDVSHMLPRSFIEKRVRVYCKKLDSSEAAKK